MSYDKRIKEEIVINNVDCKTYLAVKMISEYIYRFISMPRMRNFYIEYAQIIADDETLTLDEFSHDGKKLKYRLTKGRNKGKWASVGNKPSAFWAFREWANRLCDHKKVAFKISYSGEMCLGADYGADYWGPIFVGIDCDSLRENITYKCLQTQNWCEDQTELFSFGINGFSESNYNGQYEAVKDIELWEGMVDLLIEPGDSKDKFTDEELENLKSFMAPYEEKYGVAPLVYDNSYNEYEYLCIKKADLLSTLSDLEEIYNYCKEKGFFCGNATNYLSSWSGDNFASIYIQQAEGHFFLCCDRV